MAAKTSLQWSALLNGIAKELRDDDIRIAKQLMYSRYKNDNPNIARDIDKIENHTDLFIVLQRLDLIGIDDTELLHELLEEICALLIPELVEFEQARQKELEELGSVAGVTSSKNQEPFIGRDNAMDDIQCSLQTSTTQIGGVCIAGLPGMGKTRLAQEACATAIGDGWIIYGVDLKEKDTIDSILPAIMNSLHLSQREKSNTEDDKFRVLHKLKTFKKGGRRMILWLDNVDRPLEPDHQESPNIFRDEFVSFLREVVDLSNPRVKILITTQYGIPNVDVFNNVFTTIRLDTAEYGLNIEEASQYIQDYSKQRRITKKDAQNLARQCGMCPLLMKMVVGSLQGSTVKVKEIIAALQYEPAETLMSLQKRGFAADHKIEAGFRKVVEFLDDDEKRDLIMLAVFPGSFTVEAAATVLDSYAMDEIGKKKKVPTATLR